MVVFVDNIIYPDTAVNIIEQFFDHHTHCILYSSRYWWPLNLMNRWKITVGNFLFHIYIDCTNDKLTISKLSKRSLINNTHAIRYVFIVAVKFVHVWQVSLPLNSIYCCHLNGTKFCKCFSYNFFCNAITRYEHTTLLQTGAYNIAVI